MNKIKEEAENMNKKLGDTACKLSDYCYDLRYIKNIFIILSY
jgi:hypothetical protein